MTYAELQKGLKDLLGYTPTMYTDDNGEIVVCTHLCEKRDEDELKSIYDDEEDEDINRSVNA